MHVRWYLLPIHPCTNSHMKQKSQLQVFFFFFFSLVCIVRRIRLYNLVAPLVALMSALSVGEPVVSADGKRTYSFKQPVVIPSYLIALAVGDVVSRTIGPRSAVWSEPAMVDAGAFEFVDTEKFVAAGEDLLGPYVWGRYDLLLLPPSFPYGGMENVTTFSIRFQFRLI